MIQVTIFSGHEGRLRSNRKFYLTIFAGCRLARPTIARQILAARQATQAGQAGFSGAFFLTLFGEVRIKAPTLAEEFMDLQEMVRSEVLRMEDWDRALADLGRSEISVSSFTLFGGFSECQLPSENEEVDSLAVQRHIGNIPEAVGEVLQLGIGQSNSERLATIRRAVQTAP